MQTAWIKKKQISSFVKAHEQQELVKPLWGKIYSEAYASVY